MILAHLILWKLILGYLILGHLILTHLTLGHLILEPLISGTPAIFSTASTRRDPFLNTHPMKLVKKTIHLLREFLYHSQACNFAEIIIVHPCSALCSIYAVHQKKIVILQRLSLSTHSLRIASEKGNVILILWLCPHPSFALCWHSSASGMTHKTHTKTTKYSKKREIT